MTNRIDIGIAAHGYTASVWGFDTWHLVQTPSGVLYAVYLDKALDVVFRKSTDGGFSWDTPVSVFAGSATQIAVWYDRWSNISAGLIHIAYTESATDDTLYRTIDTESSDALSTQTVIFAGVSTAAGGHLSIVRAVGGNVYCKTVIDAGAEGGFYRLPTANVPNGAWDAARTVDEAIATSDQMILHPDFDAADNQDIMAFFWDASASEISRKLYDDSANSWAETSISGSMTPASTAGFYAAQDISGTQSVVIAWTQVDAVNADLKCWTVDSGTITACTDVVTNSTDDQAWAAIAIDTSTGHWYVFYAGKSDGSEAFSTSMKVYCKVSTDGGSTWSAETAISNSLQNMQSAKHIATTPNFSSAFGYPPVAYMTLSTNTSLLIVNVPLPRRRASHQLYGG